MGSGKLLKRAILKHGVENFTKEILHIFSSEEEMNSKEAEIVNETYVLRDDTYNLCHGGQGGFGHIHSSDAHTKNRLIALSDFTNTEINHKRLRKLVKYSNPIARAVVKDLWENDVSWRNEQSERLSKIWIGRKHTEESKLLISKSLKGKCVGPNNSQYGTCWITNGVTNMKIKKGNLNSLLTDGWKRGRTMKRK